MAQETLPEENRPRIKITLGDKVLTATLEDNHTARDFARLLPLDLTLEDYAGTEKISDLPVRLDITDAPPGSDPSAGDITYYAPWGNLALFYKDFRYSQGLVILGRIQESMEPLALAGSMRVSIELIANTIA